MAYLMGSHPVEAVGMLARQCHTMEAEDLGMGVLRMANGSFCTIAGTTSSDPAQPEASFFVLCTDGSLSAGIRCGKPFFNIQRRSGPGGRLRRQNLRYVIRFVRETCAGYGVRWLPRLGKPHSWILRDLCDAVRTDKAPRADGESGERALQSVVALYYAAKEQRAVSLPLDDAKTKTRFEMDL
jgi:UDP-N-acetyl-2-amino-2-deoxyglucuronate dehydrogenase